jgi:hypothetical protein
VERWSSRVGFLLAGSVAFPWQYAGPTVEALGRHPRIAVLVGEGVVLSLVGRWLARRFPSRLRRRREAEE